MEEIFGKLNNKYNKIFRIRFSKNISRNHDFSHSNFL